MGAEFPAGRWGGGGRDSRHCSACRGEPSDPAARADLDTLWLISCGGGVVARRFCRGCAPAGPVDEVLCAVCGDGPLLSGELAEPDLIASAAIEAWLRETGWHTGGPRCPRCASTRPRGTGTAGASRAS